MANQAKLTHCPACYSKDIDSSNLFLFKRYNYEKQVFYSDLGVQCKACGHFIPMDTIKTKEKLTDVTIKPEYSYIGSTRHKIVFHGRKE
jgi:Pyruvate/2-oxoacid:ferredoxin oxidoreductase delta subunit